jgi:uncharacterized protein (DUF58 family)
MRSRAGVLLALFVLSAAAALTSGRQLFANLAYLLGFLLATSYLWSRISLSGVTLRRRAPSSRSQVGVPFEEHFALTNTSRFPKVWVEMEDRSDFPDHQVSTVFTNLDARGARSWTVRTMCVRRGRFHLGPGTLRGGDPFGIFPVAQFLPESQSVVVLPMVLPLAHFPVPSGRRGGGEALRQRTHQVTPNASGVRDYAPGDSLNRIHWPSTARRRRLIAKEFELDPMADAWLLLDASHRSQSSLPAEPTPARRPLMGRKVTLPPSTIEYAVTAAASIALYLLNRSQSVGLIAHGKVREVIQADRGTAQLYRLLESLAVLEPSGSLSLQDVLKVEQAQIPRGAAVVLITASTELSVVDAARRLKRSGLPPVLVLLDASSFGGRPGSAALLEMALSAGIPTRMIRCGEMVGMALERQVDAASAVAA